MSALQYNNSKGMKLQIKLKASKIEHITHICLQLTLTVKTQLAPPKTIDSRSPGFFFSPAVARMVEEATGDVAVRGRKLLFIMMKRLKCAGLQFWQYHE